MYPSGRIMTTANSFHPGGVNLVLCDGSVRFVSDNVDLTIWRGLGTRNGEEKLDVYFQGAVGVHALACRRNSRTSSP
jgi:prepilin-type processing-associated H-X9-DG protein